MQQLWQPQTAGVEQICQLLAAYQSPGSNQAQVSRPRLAGQPTRLHAPFLRARPTPPILSTQILSQLDQCRAFPDFNNYLAYIFAQGDGYPIEVRCTPQRPPSTATHAQVRQSAGLLLKNNLKQQYASASAEYQQYLKVEKRL